MSPSKIHSFDCSKRKLIFQKGILNYSIQKKKINKALSAILNEKFSKNDENISINVSIWIRLSMNNDGKAERIQELLGPKKA